MPTSPDESLYYCYDALCGWCYGFSPVAVKLAETFGKELPVEAISGGMVTGSRQGPLSEIAAYIRQAHQQVEQLSGVQFGAAFLEKLEPGHPGGQMPMSSETPGLAMSVFKSLDGHKPTRSAAFAHALQKALYYEGKDLQALATYLPIVADFGIDGEAFTARMDDAAYIRATQQEFTQVQEWQVQGFPTLIYRRGRSLYAIARGFRAYEAVAASLEHVRSLGNSSAQA